VALQFANRLCYRYAYDFCNKGVISLKSINILAIVIESRVFSARGTVIVITIYTSSMFTIINKLMYLHNYQLLRTGAYVSKIMLKECAVVGMSTRYISQGQVYLLLQFVIA
jgi:hypothetical protein